MFAAVTVASTTTVLRLPCSLSWTHASPRVQRMPLPCAATAAAGAFCGSGGGGGWGGSPDLVERATFEAVAMEARVLGTRILDDAAEALHDDRVRAWRWDAGRRGTTRERMSVNPSATCDMRRWQAGQVRLVVKGAHALPLPGGAGAEPTVESRRRKLTASRKAMFKLCICSCGCPPVLSRKAPECLPRELWMATRAASVIVLRMVMRLTLWSAFTRLLCSCLVARGA